MSRMSFANFRCYICDGAIRRVHTFVVIDGESMHLKCAQGWATRAEMTDKFSWLWEK